MRMGMIAAAVACTAALMIAHLAPSLADGMPEAEDENFDPVPSVPGVPAPGVTPPPPIKPAKPAPAPVAAPTPVPAITPPAPPVTPPPAPAAAPVPTPAPSVTPPPAPAVVPPAPPASPPSISSQQRTIYEVVSVDIALTRKNPAAATITVKGTARTGGWKNIELRPLQTFAPEVGMRSFTLVGTPPSGMATQALTPVSTSITIDPLPADVKTIRVLSESNEIAQSFVDQ